MRLPLPVLLLTSGLLAACSGSSPGTTLASPSPASRAVTAAPTVPAPTPTSSRSRAATGSPEPSAVPQDPLSPKPPLESAPAPGLPTCQAASLSVVDADQLGTADAVQEVFALRTSGRDCQLEGWPSVTFRDAQGRAVPVTVRHGGFGLPEASPTVVTLSRSTSASFIVATGTAGRCVPAATVVIGLPGAGTALRASTTMAACAGQAGVSPVGRRGDGETG